MNSGSLRHRVTIQSLTKTSDGTGGFTETWTDAATVWAEVTPLKGFERYAAQQIRAQLSYRVRLRFRNDVTSDMRLIHKGKILTIQAVINVNGRNRELELLCSESGVTR